MLRYFFSILIMAVFAVIAFAGIRGTKTQKPPIEIFRDMDHQPKFQPQHGTNFFTDGRAARNPIEGTVPLGYQLKGAYYQTGASNFSTDSAFTNQPDYRNTGKIGEFYGDGLPVAADEKLLDRGQERYDIHCAICHGKTGEGNGIVKQYGLATVATLIDQRITTMPDGQIFNTITHGKGTMGAYGPQTSVEDRWAIIAYLRALQKARNGKLADLPEATQKTLK